MKYTSCEFLEHGIYFYYESIRVCCLLTGELMQPFFIKPNYKGEPINWDEIINFKRQLRENHKKGIITPVCKGCYNLQDREWDEEDNSDVINIFNFSHWTKCNCNCIYCYTEQDKKAFNSHKHYKVMPILKEMHKKGLLNFKGKVDFGGGEPAVLDEFDDIINFFLKNNIGSIVTNSSGIKFVKSIAKGISKDVLSVTVSVDAGSRETYKKIKKVDAYNKVIDNLKKYVKAQNTNKKLARSKYIIIPGVNTSTNEINSWIKTSRDIGIQELVLDVEGNWYCNNRQNLPHNIIDLFMHIKEKTVEAGLSLRCYSYGDQLILENNLGQFFNNPS